MAQLIIESGPERGRSFTLPTSGVFGIGRDEKCGLQIDDNMASRVHCLVRCVDARTWVLEDGKSLNGTRVNGEPVSKHSLALGDSVQVGDTLLSFAETEEDPLVGRTIGGYRVKERLGRGAMGTVYLAQQLSLDRPIALKILAPRFAKDEEFIRRFVEEARAAARLNHPNVVQVYDAGNEGDCHFMSMEYLEGGSLEELLEDRGCIDIDRSVRAARDAALALGFARQNHIVHRDIKPANLMIASDGTVKVGDLGIATDLSAYSEGTQQPVAGSPRYMAPEQARGEIVDHRADIYALGATLYRMVSGVPPFDGASISEIVQAKLNSDPVPLRRRDPNVPAGLSAVVQRMMARDLGERYENADEVYDALDPAALRRVPAPRRKSKPRAAVRSAAAARGGGSRSSSSRGKRAAQEQSLVSMLVTGMVAVALLVAVLVVVSKMSGNRSEDDSSGAPRVEITAKTGDGTAKTVDQDDDGDRGPVRDPSRVAMRDFRRIEKDYAAGDLTAAQARQRLETLVADHSRVAAIGKVQELLAEVRKAAAAVGLAANEALQTEVEGHLEKGRVRDAWSAIRDFRGEHPSFDDARLKRLEDGVVAACERLVGAAREKVESAIGVGDLDTARREADVALASLPITHSPLTRPLFDAIEKARTFAEQRARTLGAIGGEVRRHLGLLDFDAAQAAIAAALAQIDPEVHTKAAAQVMGLKADVAAARGAWEGLTSRLAALAKSRAITRVTVLPSDGDVDVDEPEPRRLRVVGVESPAVRLVTVGSRASGEVFARPVLSLADGDLQAFAIDGAGPGVGVDVLRRGLGLLLLTRHGEDRAAPFLRADTIDEETLEANEILITAVATSWMRHRLDTARRLETALLDRGKKATGDLWSYIADEAATLIGVWRGVDGWEAVADTVRELYLAARQGALDLLPPDSLFNAAEVTRESGGVLRLAYDFSTAEQILDFVPLRTGRGRIEWIESRKLAKISDEVRFLGGDPFTRKIGVVASVPKGGYTVSSPNINVALWTRETDRVTAQSDGNRIDYRRWRPDPAAAAPAPADFFVVGMGYLWDVDVGQIARSLSIPSGARALVENFLPKYMREPTLVLLAGERGSSLHRVPSERIWDSPSESLIRGGVVRFSVEMSTNTLAWKLNNRLVNIHSSGELDRLSENGPHSGSISFFTNGNSIYLSSLEVFGQLDPEWSGTRVRAVAEKELAALDPEFKRSRADDAAPEGEGSGGF